MNWRGRTRVLLLIVLSLPCPLGRLATTLCAQDDLDVFSDATLPALDEDDSVLPPACRARVSVEAAATLGWERWVGDDGLAIGMHGFGASAPYEDLYAHFGFTPDKVAEQARAVVERVATPAA